MEQTTPSTAAVQVHDLAKCFGANRHPVWALDGVSLSLKRGEFMAVMGASGSGKSTLLHLIAALETPTRGEVFVAGQSLSKMSDRHRTIFRRRHIGLVFQDYNLLATLTARENIALPALIDGVDVRRLRARVDELLETVHLRHRADHRPDALSGGEQQRVTIARALVLRPAVLLADEPTGNVDSQSSVEIWQLLRRLCDEHHATVLMVTHEAAAAAYADRICVMRDGRIIGTIEGDAKHDAAMVAARYQQLLA